MSNAVELGCGLIAIGRKWGTTPEVPTDAEAQLFLRGAYQLGIRAFDTAPAYGSSEERLGTFLQTLALDPNLPAAEDDVLVATKFGELWNPDTREAYTDHSADAMMRSMDRSMSRLGGIGLLQLHKATIDVLSSKDLERAMNYAYGLEVGYYGVSVSDAKTALFVIKENDWGFESIQLPYNQNKPEMQACIAEAQARGMQVLVNRPFEMGAITQATDKCTQSEQAYRYILQAGFTVPYMADNIPNLVLTGTANLTHLKENIEAFELARTPA